MLADCAGNLAASNVASNVAAANVISDSVSTSERCQCEALVHIAGDLTRPSDGSNFLVHLVRWHATTEFRKWYSGLANCIAKQTRKWSLFSPVFGDLFLRSFFLPPIRSDTVQIHA